MKKFWLVILICLTPLCLFGCNKSTTTLSAPVGLTVSDGIVRFERVTNAQYYIIYFNDISVKVMDRQSEDGKVVFSAMLDKSYLNYNAKSIFALGGQFSVSVKAVSGEVQSKISAVVHYTYLEKLSPPSELRVQGGILSWRAVLDAEYYMVDLPDGSSVRAETNTLDVTEYLTSGEVSFSVTAYAQNKIASDSASVTVLVVIN